MTYNGPEDNKGENKDMLKVYLLYNIDNKGTHRIGLNKGGLSWQSSKKREKEWRENTILTPLCCRTHESYDVRMIDVFQQVVLRHQITEFRTRGSI